MLKNSPQELPDHAIINETFQINTGKVISFCTAAWAAINFANEFTSHAAGKPNNHVMAIAFQ
jgi:hypothetical protein